MRSGVLFLATLLCLLATAEARAHRVNVFAWMEGGHLLVEGNFGKGRPARDAVVEVFGQADQVLQAAGATNASGQARLPVSEVALAQGLRVVLRAGEGHQGEWLLEPSSQAAPTPEPALSPSAQASHEVAPDVGMQRDLDALRHEVAALSSRVAALEQQLAQPEPGLLQALAGVAIIFGLGGMVALLRRRG